MDRRDILKAGIASVIPTAQAAELTVPAGEKLVAFVVKVDAFLSVQAKLNLSAIVQQAFANTEWKDVPVLVMERGMDIRLMNTGERRLEDIPEEAWLTANEVRRLEQQQ